MHEVRAAVDIEGGGNGIHCNVVSVGLATYSTRTRSYTKQRWSILTDWDEIHNPEWWELQRGPDGTPLFDFLQREATEGKTAWAHFYEAYTNAEAVASARGDSFRLLSDNPSYDIHHVEMALFKHGLRQLSLRMGQNGKYRGVDDPWSEMRHHPNNIALLRTASTICPATHVPDDDAAHIVEMWNQLYPSPMSQK